MALRGNLNDFALADVFQLIALSRKTGVLRLHRRDASRGAVWFRDGDIFFAESNWRRERLGDRLVAARRITPDALQQAVSLRAAQPQGRRLGTILVEEGHISREVLEAFVREQILDTVFDLMRWEDGEFDFELTFERPEEDIGLSVSIENIAMESGRRLEEWERIKRKVPSMDIVFRMSTAPGEGPFEISLKPIEWNLLLLVDGTRSVSEVARAAQMTDFDVAKVVYGLFSAGLLEVVSDEEASRLRSEKAAAGSAWVSPAPVTPQAQEQRASSELPPPGQPEVVAWYGVESEQDVLEAAEVQLGPGISELEVRYERMREVSAPVPAEGIVGYAPQVAENEYPQWPPVQPPFVEPSQPEQDVAYVEPAQLSPEFVSEVDTPPAETESTAESDVVFDLIGQPPYAEAAVVEIEGEQEVTWSEASEDTDMPAPVDADLATLGIPEGASPLEAPIAPAIAPEAAPDLAPAIAPEAAPDLAPDVAPELVPEVTIESDEWPGYRPTSAAYSDPSFDVRMDLAESSAISEEITELTGVGRAPGPMPRTSSPRRGDQSEAQTHTPVDKQTLLGIIEGIKRL